jgi:DNA polymerase-1
MLVTKRNVAQLLEKILSDNPKEIALDTETTGIWSWESPHVEWYRPRVFSVQLHYEGNSFYFDFNHSEDKLEDFSLLSPLFSRVDVLWFIQNAKFELHQLRNHGLEIAGEIHCTKQAARLFNNLEESISLDALGTKYLNAPKLDVKTLIDEQGLKTKVRRFGVNDNFEDWLHFDKLPLAMLVDYGEKDTEICWQLGKMQLAWIKEESSKMLALGSKVTVQDCYENEKKLTKACFEMESVGVKIDAAYTKKAYESEVNAYREIEKKLDLEAALILPDKIDWLSPKKLKALFDALKQPYEVTEKGTASFDKDSLEKMQHPIAQDILKYRFHYKRAHTYFEALIWLADKEGVLHADFQPGGTQTGRMSCWNPNLQNIPKRTDKKSDDFKVRKCFVPREGFFFADFDYQAAEYRLMIDYAKETTWASAVIAGEDVHETTKKMLDLTDRDTAKTLNFGLLYGMGVQKFGVALKTTTQNAKRLKQAYFDKLPGVQKFIKSVKLTAESRGYLFTFSGRKLVYDYQSSFKAPNGLIQGGVGDMCKIAMVNCHEFLKDKKSRMILQVHDSILFEIALDETHLIPEIKRIMQSAYPHKILPMQVEGEYSNLSWGDLKEDIS